MPHKYILSKYNSCVKYLKKGFLSGGSRGRVGGIVKSICSFTHTAIFELYILYKFTQDS